MSYADESRAIALFLREKVKALSGCVDEFAPSRIAELEMKAEAIDRHLQSGEQENGK